MSFAGTRNTKPAADNASESARATFPLEKTLGIHSPPNNNDNDYHLQ